MACLPDRYQPITRMRTGVRYLTRELPTFVEEMRVAANAQGGVQQPCELAQHIA